MSEKTTLQNFIMDNYPLFASVGVAGGLTALFTRIPETEPLVAVSFLIFLVLDVELWIASWKITAASPSLTVFSLLCGTLLAYVAVYLFVFYTYSLFWIILTVVPLLFGGIVVGFLRRVGKRESVRYLGLAIIGVFAGALMAYLVDTFLV